MMLFLALVGTAALLTLIPWTHPHCPLIPLTLVGAAFMRPKRLAFFLPIAFEGLRMAASGYSSIYFFTGASLLVAVWIALRWLQPASSRSLLAVSLTSVLFYELLSNFGVWLIAGCVPGQPALYASTFSGLLSCYQAAVPYSLYHLLRDVPLTLIVFKAISLVRVPDILPAADGLRSTVAKST